MINPSDITGVDDDTARRVLVIARGIAPCLNSLEDEAQLDAIAILRGVAREVVARGSRMVASQRIGPAAVSYVTVRSSFSDEDRSALRSLCGAAVSGGPAGSFPQGRPFSNVWPEFPSACK